MLNLKLTFLQPLNFASYCSDFFLRNVHDAAQILAVY